MDYSTLKDEDFERILAEIIKEDAAILLTVPGAYEVFSEYYNNEVLNRWEAEQEEKREPQLNHWIITWIDLENKAGDIRSCGFPDDLNPATLPIEFRMYDDDDNLYFTGRMAIEDFDPLDDYGTPDAGCTYIETRTPKRPKWEIL